MKLSAVTLFPLYESTDTRVSHSRQMARRDWHVLTTHRIAIET